ncbi:hypothetical protein IIK97_004067 [Salmonella enterica subsp. enterica serovar Nigeria]|nr:hypothetical protein [Salmonella enterica subsp. enterica serovar Nigeria]
MSNLLITKEQFIELLQCSETKFRAITAHPESPKSIRNGKVRYWHRRQAELYAEYLLLKHKQDRANSYRNAYNQLAVSHRHAVNFVWMSSNFFGLFGEKTDHAHWLGRVQQAAPEMTREYSLVKNRLTQAEEAICSTEKALENFDDGRDELQAILLELRTHLKSVTAINKAVIRPFSQISGGNIPNEEWVCPADPTQDNMRTFAEQTAYKSQALRRQAEELTADTDALFTRSNEYAQVNNDMHKTIRNARVRYEVYSDHNEVQIELIFRQLATQHIMLPEPVFLPEHPTFLQRLAVWFLKKTLK